MRNHGSNFMPNALATAAAAGRSGHFDGYSTAIKRYKLLERNQEQQLARRWQEQGDRVATDTLVTSHLRLAAKVARERLTAMPYDVAEVTKWRRDMPMRCYLFAHPRTCTHSMADIFCHPHPAAELAKSRNDRLWPAADMRSQRRDVRFLVERTSASADLVSPSA